MIGLVFTISSVCSTKQFLFYAGFIKKQLSWQAMQVASHIAIFHFRPYRSVM